MSDRPADPVVSPAEPRTVLRAYAEQLPTVLSVPNLRTALREAADEIDALLAVGERDKAEIEALTAAVEGLLEVETRSRRGDPSLEAEEWYAIRDYAQKVLKDGGIAAALKESRERDRQHIAQLTEAAELAAEKIEYAQETATGWLTYRAAMQDALAYLRAVLADKEDADNG